MSGATVKRVSLLVLIFEQGVVPANNATTLCVTIVCVDGIFNCGQWAWRKKATCGREEQTSENAFVLKYIHREADDANRKKKGEQSFKQNSHI